jgi:hypothetical protein
MLSYRLYGKLCHRQLALVIDAHLAVGNTKQAGC